MPFSLRSDEELIAEAQRALEALGVEVVIDRTSSSARQCVEDNMLTQGSKVAIATSRAIIDSLPAMGSEQCAALLVTAVVSRPPDERILLVAKAAGLSSKRDDLDSGAGAVAWWRKVSRQRSEQRTEEGAVTCKCCVCRRRRPKEAPACQQCHADFCAPCAMGRAHDETCPVCGAWYLDGRVVHGVPWHMPRPAAPRTAAAPAPSSSALPQHMAAAVGPDGWLRPPPRHQRMHPVDALVDGVLAALDGNLGIEPRLPHVEGAEGDKVALIRTPQAPHSSLMGSLISGLGAETSVDSVRRRLKKVVDRLMREAARTSPIAQEVFVPVRDASGALIITRTVCPPATCAVRGGRARQPHSVRRATCPHALRWPGERRCSAGCTACTRPWASPSGRRPSSPSASASAAAAPRGSTRGSWCKRSRAPGCTPPSASKRSKCAARGGTERAHGVLTGAVAGARRACAHLACPFALACWAHAAGGHARHGVG